MIGSGASKSRGKQYPEPSPLPPVGWQTGSGVDTETECPLSNRLLWKDLVHQKCCRFRYAPGASAGAETPALAADCDQSLRMTALAAHSQETTLQPPTAQKLIKFPANVVWDHPALTGHPLRKRRVVLLGELVMQRLLGPMALVTVRMHFRLRCTC